MAKPKVYITRKIPDKLLEPYMNGIDFQMWKKEGEPVPREVLLEKVKDADGLVTMLSDAVDKELLNHADKLKISANSAVGFDNIDTEAAKEKGVIITNTPDVLTETTADLGFALLMATARRIIEANKYIANDQWKNWAPYLLAGSDIHHKTIGIVGMGRIGEAIARRARGFEMTVLYHNRSRKPEAEKELQAVYTDFDKLLNEADFVISVVPLSSETLEMFDESAFKKMKSSGIFINISRGATVDEKALFEALKTNEITAAGLDVFVEEPIRKDHPLMTLDNVICLPHIGSATEETRTAMLELCLENIASVLNGGKPKTPVQ